MLTMIRVREGALSIGECLPSNLSMECGEGIARAYRGVNDDVSYRMPKEGREIGVEGNAPYVLAVVFC